MEAQKVANQSDFEKKNNLFSVNKSFVLTGFCYKPPVKIVSVSISEIHVALLFRITAAYFLLSLGSFIKYDLSLAGVERGDH